MSKISCRPLILCLLVLLFGTGPGPALAGSALRDGGEGVVVKVVDGDTLVLSDGRSVRLVGIQAPKLPLGRKHIRKQPFADQSKRALEDLTLGKTLRLSYGGREQDRYRRALAHLHTPDGIWIQGRLLELGLARVYSFRDNRARVADMLALEARARADKKGLWGHSFYTIRGVLKTETYDIDTFQVVSGLVHNAARVRGRVYLNFAEDWRRDFTVTISGRDARAFAKSGVDMKTWPASWVGKRLRVRGWIYWRNGPMIDATHPEQIEVLDE
jgi:endonuclease YncB( thermonuclease family)